MDATTLRLVDYASGAEFNKLPADAVHECKRRLIDSVGCAVGAYDEPLCRMARAVARRYSGTPASRVWGCNWKTTAEAATFANGIMLRFLDHTDAYPVKSRGHPSDVIAAVLSVGDALKSDGTAVISATVLAYDVFCSFCETIDINSQGWDQAVYAGIATVMGVGKLLNLTREQMGNAIALTVAPNMGLYQARLGELSSWKGGAAPNACRNGVFAALLARDGFTGPADIFEGKAGLWNVVGRFDWQIPIGPSSPHRVTKTHMKCFPVCYHGQSTVWAGFELRKQVRAQDISEVHIETYRQAIRIMADDPSRWAPATRETADHSLPYVLAVALLDGEFTSQSFSSQRLVDRTVADVMAKVKVSEDKNLSALHPEAAPCRVHVRTSSGKSFVSEVMYPRGHASNPMSDEEIEAKFRDMFSSYGSTQRCEAVLKALWNLDQAPDISAVLDMLVTGRCAASG